ncbi:MAG: Bug family tripartite tricarboxylate transporter substrate binding protein [Burkholderiales bacterium]
MSSQTFRLLFVAGTLLLSTSLGAQDYPSKPIKIIIPVPPGAAVERMARLVGDRLSSEWNQPVVVESRSGAAGNIGAEFFAKSAPDGYTLMVTAASVLVINKSLYSKLTYNPDNFVPVTIIASSPNVLMMHPKPGIDNIRELMSYAKSNPEKLNFGSGGSGSTAHLTAELFTSMAGIKLTHIPYKGSAPAITDLLGGQVDMVFIELGSALPHVRSGKLRALAVGSEKRAPVLPDVPAIAEVLPGYVSSVWFGMVAPPGTPAAIAGKLSSSIAEGVKQPAFQKRLSELGVDGRGSTPAEMALFMKQESDRWGKVIKSAGIVPE